MALDLIEWGPDGKPLDAAGGMAHNFQLFAAVAAMSERVFKMNELLERHLASSRHMSPEALHLKLREARGLFYVNDPEHTGAIDFDIVAAEFEACSIPQDVQQQVFTELRDQGKTQMEYFDFLIYLPLFIALHDEMVHNPLERSSLEVAASEVKS